MLSVKVLYAFPLDNMRLLVFFEDDTTKIFDVKPIVKDYPEFAALENPDLFNLVKVEPGGYGVSWNSELDCSEGELYENGEPIPLSFEDFKNFARFSEVELRVTVETNGNSHIQTIIDEFAKLGYNIIKIN